MDSRQGILKTLLYADIFNYPLKRQEILNFFISSNYIDEKSLAKGLRDFRITNKNGYYCLKGREEIIQIRKNREKISLAKIKKAKKIIKKISGIPSIKLIGISGALSMKNASEVDDIDLFIVTEKKLVWTTRLLLVFYLSFLGVYRKRNSSKYQDKICLNMIVGEDAVDFKGKYRNLYIAHEIFQLVPVFDRNNTYKKFIKANEWAKNFLANALFYKNEFKKNKTSLLDKFIIFILQNLFLEIIARFLQLKYMQNHITNEIIKDNFLGLHPFDYQTHILKMYKKKLTKFKVNY